MKALARLRAEERGGIVVLTAVIAGALVLVSAFVFDVGNWQEHRRHLQGQVDSGALAAGTYFTGCFQEPADTNANIAREARRFAGDPRFNEDVSITRTARYPSETDGPFNNQVDDPTRVHIVLNGSAYPTGPGDETDAWDPGNLGDPNAPCNRRWLDVKATDIGVPSFFSSVIPDDVNPLDVKAKAKVEVRKVKILSGFMPWAVPEVKPEAVAVMFVANGTDQIVTSQLLNPPGSNTLLNGESLAVWEADAAVSASTDNFMVVLTSTEQLQLSDLTGTLATACAPTSRSCYHGTGGTDGLVYIHGWPKSAGNGVTLRDVTLENLGCSDESAPYFQWNAACNFRLRAEIDFGPHTSTTPKTVRIQGPGCNGPGCPLSLFSGLWTSGALNLNVGSGRGSYGLTWEAGSGPAKVSGSVSNIANPFAATDDAQDNGFSGPVQYVAVTGAGGSFANSLQLGGHTVHVAVGLKPPLAVAQPGDPPILLRIASKSGSLNQALDCDLPNRGLAEEVRDGCQSPYQVNERNDVCAPWMGSDLPYDPADDPNTLPAPYPPDCIAAKTGDVTKMAQGLHDRFESPCSPNLWEAYRAGDELPPPEDPRWVTLVVTNFTAFSGSGATLVPIRVFAGFYVTGWFQQASANGCGDNDAHPNGVDPTDNGAKGDVWGYFVTTVIPVPGGQEDEELCEFSEIGACQAVLTE